MTSRYLPVRTRRALAEQETCAICGGPGPFHREHHVPHALGGSNEPENMRLVCIDPCHLAKSRNDVRMIAKANRIARKCAGTWIGRKSRPMQSRGFDRTLRKRFDGTVERRWD